MQRIISKPAGDFACGINYTFYAVATTEAGNSTESVAAEFSTPACTTCGLVDEACSMYRRRSLLGSALPCCTGLACATTANNSTVCANPPGAPNITSVLSVDNDVNVNVTVTPPADTGATGVGAPAPVPV